MKQMLSNAIAFATLKHDGQFDKAGMPYILHCLKVMHYLKTEDEELMCIAVLHDVIEDTDAREHELIGLGMTRRVVHGVLSLTKEVSKTSDEYLEKILNNPDAMRVKLCDLRHNMDIRRLKGVTEKDLSRLDKYSKMYKVIKDKLDSVVKQ